MKLYQVKTEKIKIKNEIYTMTLLTQNYKIGVRDKKGVVHYLNQNTEVEEIEE
ncbi:MAG: hypothetical protein GX675_01275 [Erysipelotrichaceae bacterium]|nr:hypothetical protein [Erysipelotrichaceae bacterium]